MSISIFLPVRKGSERIENKNTRSFAGIDGGLLRLKLNQLKTIDGISEIIVSSNDSRCLTIAEEFSDDMENLKIVKRPQILGTSNTNLEDLIRYVPTVTTGNHILWTHVTSPFCGEKQYAEAINIYNGNFNNDYDSLISGHEYKEFLIKKDSKQLINNTTELKWPRTQDLQDLFQINSAIFICSRKQMIEGDRIGENPYLFNMNKISSLDIDDMEDFKLAEIIYGSTIK